MFHVCRLIYRPLSNRIAREQGIRTVAELVEDHATEQKLRELNIDYAQGFGISQPRPLKEAQT